MRLAQAESWASMMKVSSRSRCAPHSAVAVRVAQGRGPAVVHRHAAVAGEDADGLDGLAPALGVEAFDGERATGVDVEPVVVAVHAQRGLVDVQGRHGEEAFDGAALPFGQGLMELHHGAEEGGLGEGLCDEGVHRVGGALEREPLGDEQVHDAGLEAVGTGAGRASCRGRAPGSRCGSGGQWLDLCIGVMHPLLEDDIDEGAPFARGSRCRRGLRHSVRSARR